MIIKDSTSCKEANIYFEKFHDGFIKRICLSSGFQMQTEMPWEKPKEFLTQEEKLHDTSMLRVENDSILLCIAFFNYDWPNQPHNRIVTFEVINCSYIEKKYLLT